MLNLKKRLEKLEAKIVAKPRPVVTQEMFISAIHHLHVTDPDGPRLKRILELLAIAGERKARLEQAEQTSCQT